MSRRAAHSPAVPPDPAFALVDAIEELRLEVRALRLAVQDPGSAAARRAERARQKRVRDRKAREAAEDRAAAIAAAKDRERALGVDPEESDRQVSERRARRGARTAAGRRTLDELRAAGAQGVEGRAS